MSHKRTIPRGLYFELSSCTEPSRPDQTRIDTCAKCHGLKFSLNIEHSQPSINDSLIYLAINFVKKKNTFKATNLSPLISELFSHKVSSSEQFQDFDKMNQALIVGIILTFDSV